MLAVSNGNGNCNFENQQGLVSKRPGSPVTKKLAPCKVGPLFFGEECLSALHPPTPSSRKREEGGFCSLSLASDQGDDAESEGGHGGRFGNDINVIEDNAS